MPATYNLPRITAEWDQQEVDRYNKLPFYLAMQAAKYWPQWNVYNKLLGTVKWQQNMGTTMKGVIVEPSPIGRSEFVPNPITQTPRKDIISQYERTNTAIVRRHLYESPQINFLPSFQDFRTKQIQTAQKDIGQQITVANDFFVRTAIFHGSPYVYISGRQLDANGDAGLVSAPNGDPNVDPTLSAKHTNYLADVVGQVGNNKGNLSLKLTSKLTSIMQDDLQIVPFEGMVNTPKDNETIKGKYVIVGSGEAFRAFTFDEHILQYKTLNLDLINDEFSGLLFGNTVYKIERFPLRIAADGTLPVPQLYEANPAAFNGYETVPNPVYVKAPIEVAFMFGGGSWESINVGPPPSEFAGGKISEEKFNKLFWNGEVKITDNILINYGSAATPQMDTNKYGEALQMISSTVHGIISINRRAVIPIIYRRWRVETN